MKTLGIAIIVLCSMLVGYMGSSMSAEVPAQADTEIVVDTLFTDSDVEGLTDAEIDSMSFEFTGAFGGKLAEPLSSQSISADRLRNN